MNSSALPIVTSSDSQQRLLSAAERLFAKFGYNGVSLRLSLPKQE
jgi:AcrR family transcriptional regulator